MKKIATILALAGLAMMPGAALADMHGHGGGHSLEQLVIEMAHTPEQHAALARHYEALAQEARAEAQRHQSMGAAYSTGKLTQQAAMKRHCEKIAGQYKAMAEDYDALAKLHQGHAKGGE